MNIESRLRKLIMNNGYVDLEQAIECAMSSGHYSYYRSREAIGKSGDFITSPEVSQMFGEMLCIWCHDVWKKMSMPSRIRIIELGPGNGTLMTDILRTAKKIDTAFYESVREISMVEINRSLIQKQKEALLQYHDKTISWYKNIRYINIQEDIIVIANEFFDAMPIRQYVMIKDSWNLVCINMHHHQDTLRFTSIPISKRLQQHLMNEHQNARDGAVVEESPTSSGVIRYIGEKLRTQNGAMLIIDYGYDVEPKKRMATQYYGTLQCVKNHQFCDFLSSLGEADISSHVDFHAIKKCANTHSLCSFGSVSQGTFLKNLGIEIRLNILKSLNPKMSHRLQSEYNRLTCDNEMGSLFKVLALTSNGVRDIHPIGFE